MLIVNKSNQKGSKDKKIGLNDIKYCLFSQKAKEIQKNIK